MELPFMASEAIIVEMVKHGANRQVQCVVCKCSYTEAVICNLVCCLPLCGHVYTKTHTLRKIQADRVVHSYIIERIHYVQSPMRVQVVYILHIHHSTRRLFSNTLLSFHCQVSMNCRKDLSTVSLKEFSKFPTAEKKAESPSYATWEVAHAQGTQGLQYKPRT